MLSGLGTPHFLFVLGFASITAFLWIAVVASAGLVRGRFFALFAGLILGVHSASAIALYPYFDWCWPVFLWFHGAVFVHFGSLTWARLRPLPFRLAFSIPGMFFAAGMIFAVPWSVAAAVGFEPWAPWLPFVLAAVGLVQSVSLASEEVDVHLDGEVVAVDGVARHPHGVSGEGRSLRVVQVSDPHLGPFMSVSRLSGICERAVRAEPDLIFLTGDFMTMESQQDPRHLARALAPLAAAKGRVFACFGNHDHEAPEIVRSACAAHRITLLVDEEATIDTKAGPVQIVGADFAYRDRAGHLAALVEKYPRRANHLRVILLHDPGAFRHLPSGHGDIVFSGHTHGGQVGLVSLGLPWTFVSGLTSMPDHGLWARGRDRLYVHRGTGHYGFPLRLGVPAEESVVTLWLGN